MKKVILITFATLLLAASFSSCKTHERCPAYSKADAPTAADVRA